MNGINDQRLLELGLAVVNLQPAQRSQDVLSVLDTALDDQEPRRLRQIDHADDDDHAKHDLKGDREPPGQVIRAVMRAEIDPVRDHRADGDDAALDADQQSPVAGPGAFGLVRRDGGRVHAVADAGDGAADEELQQGDVPGEACHLDDDADDHDRRAGDDHQSSAEAVAEEEGEDGAEEAA